MEHHSNIVPWQMLCEEKEATLENNPNQDSGELLLDEFDKLLNEKTKLVSIVHASNALGTINPVKEIIQKAHQFGAKYFWTERNPQVICSGCSGFEL
jgi:cysteine desulfurase / selenocysteine lyase